MDSAQRRALGLVAIAAWLLIDSVRTAGPLLLDLAEPSTAPVVAATVATALGGALLAWIAAEAARHLGHGGTVAFLLTIVAVFRLALPLLSGAWLIGVGLYLTALAFAAVVLTARVAVGHGGGATLLTGTSLGAAAALIEQGALRTFDAPWREDEWGWNALALLAVLAVVNGIRGRHLEPATGTRGWWAFGLYWSALLFAFANLAWIDAQAGVRMSVGLALGVLGAILGAHLASQSRVLTGPMRLGLLVVGAIAAGLALLDTGAAAAVAIPVASATAALGAALVVRPGDVSAVRRLGASLLFIVAVLGPIGLTSLDRFTVLPGPAPAIIALAVLGVLAGAVVVGRTASPAPALTGVWLRVGVLGAMGGVLAVWTWQHYEQPVSFTADAITSPVSMTWNLHQGVTPSEQDGPRLSLGDIAASIEGSGADVAMLQEVGRGSLLGGGADMVEYLTGETGLPVSFAPGLSPQVGNAILTSRPHGDVREIELPIDESGPGRTALAVSFMGYTFASTQLSGGDQAAALQAGRLSAALAGDAAVVIGGSLSDATAPGEEDGPVIDTFTADGYDALARGSATVDGREVAQVDQLVGRGVTFADVAVLAFPGSDHQPLVAAVSGADAVAPVEDDSADGAAATPSASTSPSPSPSVSVSAE